MQLAEVRRQQAASYHGEYPELCKTSLSDSSWGPCWMKGFHSEDCPTPMCVTVWDVMSWGQDPFPAALGIVGAVVGKGRKESSCYMVIPDHKPGITNQAL